MTDPENSPERLATESVEQYVERLVALMKHPNDYVKLAALDKMLELTTGKPTSEVK